jgi:hypothetical protein
MTTRLKGSGRSLQTIGAAALAVLLGLTSAGCTGDRSPATPLAAACKTATYIVQNLQTGDHSGLYQVDSLTPKLSVYQTTWRLRAAKQLRIKIAPDSDEASLRKSLLQIALGPEASDSDPGIEGLELRATAALGLSTLDLQGPQRSLVANEIAKYRTGGDYRLTLSERPSIYGTYLALQALSSLRADIPNVVQESLAQKTTHLPKASFETLDDVIIPTLGAYALSGAKPKDVGLTPEKLQNWNSLIAAAPQDGVSLSLAANLRMLAAEAKVPYNADWNFEDLQSTGAWAPQAGVAPDPQSTYYAAVLKLTNTKVSRFLKSGRALVGWLPQAGDPTIQSDYLAVRIADICPTAPKLARKGLQAELRSLSAGGASVLDLARICYIEERRNLAVVPHADLKQQLAKLAAKKMSFEDAVELRTASDLCDIAVDKPVQLPSASQPSRYHYVGKNFLDASSGWHGTTNGGRSTHLNLPSGYALLVDSALREASKGSVNSRYDSLKQFAFKQYYGPISKREKADLNSANPTVSAYVSALEAIRGGGMSVKEHIILAGS